MQPVGQKLRYVREEQGKTLEHVYTSTRIPIKILQAIEADEITAISSAFLYRSFVRQIGECLGMEHGELAQGIQDSAQRYPAPLVPGQMNRHVPKVAALPVHRKNKTRLLLALSAFGAVLVACSGMYSVWQKTKANSHARAATSETRSAAQMAGEPAASGSSAMSRAAIDKNRKANANGFRLELSATEPAWLSIVADGKPSFNGILERAEKKILEGHRTARVRTENAGVVRVVFNGRALGTLGPRGQVRTAVFTKNNYAILHGPAEVSKAGFNQSAVLMPPSEWPSFLGF